MAAPAQRRAGRARPRRARTARSGPSGGGPPRRARRRSGTGRCGYTRTRPRTRRGSGHADLVDVDQQRLRRPSAARLGPMAQLGARCARAGRGRARSWSSGGAPRPYSATLSAQWLSASAAAARSGAQRVVRREDAADEGDDRQAVPAVVAEGVDVPPEIATRRDRLVESRCAISVSAASRPDIAAIGTPGPGCTLPPARYRPGSAAARARPAEQRHPAVGRRAVQRPARAPERAGGSPPAWCVTTCGAVRLELQAAVLQQSQAALFAWVDLRGVEGSAVAVGGGVDQAQQALAPARARRGVVAAVLRADVHGAVAAAGGGGGRCRRTRGGSRRRRTRCGAPAGSRCVRACMAQVSGRQRAPAAPAAAARRRAASAPSRPCASALASPLKTTESAASSLAAGQAHAAGAAVAHQDALARPGRSAARRRARCASAASARGSACMPPSHRPHAVYVRPARSASAWPAPARATRRSRWRSGRTAGAGAGRGSGGPARVHKRREGAQRRSAWPGRAGPGRGSCAAALGRWRADVRAFEPSGRRARASAQKARKRRASAGAGKVARWRRPRPAGRQTGRACGCRRAAPGMARQHRQRLQAQPALRASCRPAARIWSNTQRMVNTVGPASMRAPSTASWRILPPGAAAASTSVTCRPRQASSSALTRPPMPAPTTTTRCVARRRAAQP